MLLLASLESTLGFEPRPFPNNGNVHSITLCRLSIRQRLATPSSISMKNTVNGIRTRVAGMKILYPRPLDDDCFQKSLK